MSESDTLVVAMPHMGVSVEEGTVIEWLVAVGDEVAADDVICAIATDKVDTEVLAPADGVLAKIVAAEGETVAVGEPIAELVVAEGVGDDSPDAAQRAAVAEAVGVDSPDAAQRGEPAADAPQVAGASGSVSGEPTPTAFPDPHSNGPRTDPGLAERAAAGRDEFGRFDPKRAAEAVLSFVSSGSGARVPASPIARRMAASHGVDLVSLRGTGRGGRIRKVDVERAVANAGASTAPPPTQQSRPRPLAKAGGLPPGYADVPHEVVETTRVRRAIAEHMSRSRQTAAHMTTEVDVDLTTLIAARTEINAGRLAAGEAKLSYLPFIARAACAALAEHPDLNATFLGERMIRWQAVNLGVAVDTPEGLLVPVVKGCEELTAPQIGAAIANLAERARTRKLVPDDLAGGTFTLSNPGSVGAVSAPAIINQPQVAVLGVPAIQRRPWVVADEHGGESIEIRSILRLAVTFDHRAVDGAGATRFAVEIKENLETWGAETYA